MLWKIMYIIGITGFFLTILCLWVFRSYETSVPQWEVKATKYKEVLPAGWEPFAYDKASNLLILKRIKREEVNGE